MSPALGGYSRRIPEDSKPAGTTECDPVFKNKQTYLLMFFLNIVKSVVESPPWVSVASLFCGDFYPVVGAGTGGLRARGQLGLHSRPILSEVSMVYIVDLFSHSHHQSQRWLECLLQESLGRGGLQGLGGLDFIKSAVGEEKQGIQAAALTHLGPFSPFLSLSDPLCGLASSCWALLHSHIPT